MTSPHPDITRPDTDPATPAGTAGQPTGGSDRTPGGATGGKDGTPEPASGATAAPVPASDGELSDAEARDAARAAWRADPTVTGAELAERFGRSERWGRQQIAAARTTSGTSGTTGNGTSGRKDNGNTGGTSGGSGTPGGTTTRPGTGRAGKPTPATTARREARAATGNGTATARPGGAARTGTVRRHPAAPAGVPVSLVLVTVAGVVLVTVVCAVVSYSHIRDLAVIAGMGSQAAWLPLGVDGLVAACSCSLIIDRHAGRRGEPLAWIGVALGLAGSLAANVLAVDPDLVSLRVVRWVLAGYPPAALAVSGHLLFRMLGEQRQPSGPPLNPRP